mgnify:CR=1 FL=1
MRPQSNQRGIETCRARVGIPARTMRLNRTSVGLKQSGLLMEAQSRTASIEPAWD